MGIIDMKLIKKYHKWRINREQEKVNKLLENDGFTDEVLEKQVKINKRRCKHQIADDTKRVYKNYVQ